MKIVIASASPDELNSNAYLLDLIANEARFLPAVTPIRCRHTDLASVVRDVGQCVVIVAGSLMGTGSALHSARAVSESAKSPMVYWSWDDPYELDVNRTCSSLFDAVFTNDEHSALFYLTPERTHHLPLGASAEAHCRPVTSARPMWDWLLVGQGFGRRRVIAEALTRHAADLVGLVSGGGWNGAAVHSLVPGPISNPSLSDLYNRSGCVLSVGRELMLANENFEVTAEAVGPRVYEVALAGAPQLLIPVVRPAEEERLLATAVVGPDDEVIEAVRNILCDRLAVLDRCRDAQRLVLDRHLYRHRIAKIIDTVA